MLDRSQRIQEIKAKGFDMVSGTQRQEQMSGYSGYAPLDYNKIKVGVKTLDDAVLKLGDLKQNNPRLADKQNILRAIQRYDLKTMREASNYFYRISGIYNRIIRYMAFMYRYDWYVTPYNIDEKADNKKMLDIFNKCLSELDNFQVKKTFGEIALKVVINGAYYGYKVKCGNRIVLQELPVDYCRSRYNIGDKPAVEFNMKFFDDKFANTAYRLKILKMFPDEFYKGYKLYKQGKLPAEYQGDDNGWYLLDTKSTVKFNVNGDDFPPFISTLPLIIDLDEMQDLNRQKAKQRLLKLVIQKLPLDKNGDLVFDIDEGQQLHNNAVQMLSRGIGLDVLTTFADTTVESMSDSSTTSSETSELEAAEAAVYTEAGVSQLQFNTDGNIALEKSITNDSATMYTLLLQFENFLNELIVDYNKNKKFSFKVQMLLTTIYNYQDLAKLYKEQTQLGYSKMLPQIALGQSQSSILANAVFENDVLNLVELFIPPLMSSTMNGDFLTNRSASKSGSAGGSSSEGAGRPEKPDDEKSTKTLQNKESES